jgi:hypothetical protein
VAATAWPVLEPGFVLPLHIDQGLWIIDGSVASMNVEMQIGNAKYGDRLHHGRRRKS